ncbi:hypothetical protein HS088_TW09G01047 [Tripterygium wilfordii]|uniref:Galactose oxidase n=1 Tax=Tripterygium wilfordii TaxID=458696 RepID=A0A7J7D9E2_TRIWF|nr:aldehyde oxidase GLOX1-like [Tripterygium wilfordii]KAF5742985.1 hypothetical protein HS088_TW09G01047 [Tripterygium wilfordii]
MPFLAMAPKKTRNSLLIILLSLLFVTCRATIFPFFRPPWLLNPMIDSNEGMHDDNSLSSQIFHQEVLDSGAGGGDVDIAAGFKGEWKLDSDNSGVSAMHSILLPKINKVLMYDATIWRISKLPYPADHPCRIINKKTGEKDCYFHSVLYDIKTAEIRPLELNTDTWCSSGGLTVDGTLVSTGGFEGGARTLRYLRDCNTCDWEEYPTALASLRWYSTQATLPDGSFIVVGGRREFNYEYIPGHGQQHQNTKAYNFPFLRETTQMDENNLYPFVYLSTDGNLFIFANNRAVLLNPKSNQIVLRYPVLPGGSRNYPANAASVLLPIKLHRNKNRKIPAEVIICGGAKPEAYGEAERKHNFMPALKDCGRMRITDPKPVWKIEQMPSARVMGDMVILPTGDVLLLNGAKKGSSGWGLAKEPNLTPALYRPKLKKGQRFSELASTNIPRMYHSSSTLLPDGKILVAGSNTNNGYQYNVEFPTELRVEKFSPPYLNPSLADKRPEIVVDELKTELKYEKKFAVKIKSSAMRLETGEVQVTMYAPPFTTHGISMNQRLLVLGLIEVISNVNFGYHSIIAEAPPSGKVAPPGYYLLFVVQQGVPSEGVWVRIT